KIVSWVNPPDWTIDIIPSAGEWINSIVTHVGVRGRIVGQKKQPQTGREDTNLEMDWLCKCWSENRLGQGRQLNFLRQAKRRQSLFVQIFEGMARPRTSSPSWSPGA